MSCADRHGGERSQLADNASSMTCVRHTCNTIPVLPCVVAAKTGEP